MGWFPELVGADCGSELYVCVWSGHCLFTFSLSDAKQSQ